MNNIDIYELMCGQSTVRNIIDIVLNLDLLSIRSSPNNWTLDAMKDLLKPSTTSVLKVIKVNFTSILL